MLVLSAVQDPQTGQQKINAAFAQSDAVNWSFVIAIAGVPINLTGMNIKMTIGFQEPLLLSTANGGIAILNASGGQFLINIPSDQTADFDPGVYDYDVWIEQSVAPPVETQYCTGQVTINPSVSAFP